MVEGSPGRGAQSQTRRRWKNHSRSRRQATGVLPHVRVVNAIRGRPEDLSTFIERQWNT